jgi:peptidoglycan/LPS O-acetylase OafA/YrhL
MLLHFYVVRALMKVINRGDPSEIAPIFHRLLIIIIIDELLYYFITNQIRK